MEALKSLSIYAQQFVLDSAFKILIAGLILVSGIIIARLVRKHLIKLFEKSTKLDQTLKPVATSLVYYTILALSILAACSKLGLEITSLIALLGAAGLAIGLALQGTMQNIAAGFMLLILRPFKAGDYIEGANVAGTVEAIELFLTTLKTAQGVCVYIPNSQLFNTSISNYNKNPSRRSELVFSIAYTDDIDQAVTALTTMANAEALVLTQPKPQVILLELADSSVNLQLRTWINANDFWEAHFALYLKGKTALEQAGCTIPFPQRDIHMVPQTNAN